MTIFPPKIVKTFTTNELTNPNTKLMTVRMMMKTHLWSTPLALPRFDLTMPNAASHAA